jgi:hypothetical protein
MKDYSNTDWKVSQYWLFLFSFSLLHVIYSKLCDLQLLLNNRLSSDVHDTSYGCNITVNA